MAARFALTSCVFHVTAGGFDDYMTIGAQRDSASAVVLQAPTLFSTTPLAYGQAPHALVDYLAVRPAGP
jgi:hypothetical protein